MFRFLLITSSLILFSQCKTTQDYLTPYEYEGRSISFGNGGGFTGKSVEYTLMDNGQIFKGLNKEGNVDMIKKISRDQVNQIFDTYDILGFDKLDVNSPGNMYFFVQMNILESEADHKVDNNKLVWGNYDSGESKELRIFHANLMSLVSKMTKPMPTKIEIQ